MQQVINAVYEDGVFKPVGKFKAPHRKHLKLIISEPTHNLQSVKPLSGIVDLAKFCPDTDVSVNHDLYLYGENPL